MTDFQAWNMTTHPIVRLEADYNNILDHAFEKAATFIVRLRGGYYEAISGTTGLIAYGGPDNAGATDGTDVDAVQQAAINNAGEGIVFLKGLALGTVTEVDGVLVLADRDGYVSYYFTNPTSEVTTLANTENLGIFNFISRPTNDPPTKSAWCTLTAEIVAPATATDYYCPAFFSAEAPNGSSCNLWGLNTISWLKAGATGNMIGYEVDLNNEATDDYGVGIAIIQGYQSTQDCYAALHTISDSVTSNLWNRGIFVEGWRDYGLIVDFGDADVGKTGIHMSMPTGYSTPKIMTVELNNELLWSLTSDAYMGFRRRTPEGATTPGTFIEYFDKDDVEPFCRIRPEGIWWGAGGAAAVDSVLYRSAANQLTTDDQLVCSDGVVTLVNAGAISDATTTVDTDGCLGVDSNNGRLYFRYGGGWHYCSQDAGFQIRKDETICIHCGHEMKEGEHVTGLVNGTMSDGALHADYVHLRCAVKAEGL